MCGGGGGGGGRSLGTQDFTGDKATIGHLRNTCSCEVPHKAPADRTRRKWKNRNCGGGGVKRDLLTSAPYGKCRETRDKVPEGRASPRRTPKARIPCPAPRLLRTCRRPILRDVRLLPGALGSPPRTPRPQPAAPAPPHWAPQRHGRRSPAQRPPAPVRRAPHGPRAAGPAPSPAQRPRGARCPTAPAAPRLLGCPCPGGRGSARPWVRAGARTWGFWAGARAEWGGAGGAGQGRGQDTAPRPPSAPPTPPSAARPRPGVGAGPPGMGKRGVRLASSPPIPPPPPPSPLRWARGGRRTSISPLWPHRASRCRRAGVGGGGAPGAVTPWGPRGRAQRRRSR